METCKHRHLVLLPQASKRLRCRHCHLTISADELGEGYCPECLAVRRVKRRDFEPLDIPTHTRYQCESCGAVIEYSVNRK